MPYGNLNQTINATPLADDFEFSIKTASNAPFTPEQKEQLLAVIDANPFIKRGCVFMGDSEMGVHSLFLNENKPEVSLQLNKALNDFERLCFEVKHNEIREKYASNGFRSIQTKHESESNSRFNTSALVGLKLESTKTKRTCEQAPMNNPRSY